MKALGRFAILVLVLGRLGSNSQPVDFNDHNNHPSNIFPDTNKAHSQNDFPGNSHGNPTEYYEYYEAYPNGNLLGDRKETHESSNEDCHNTVAALGVVLAIAILVFVFVLAATCWKLHSSLVELRKYSINNSSSTTKQPAVEGGNANESFTLLSTDSTKSSDSTKVSKTIKTSEATKVKDKIKNPPDTTQDLEDEKVCETKTHDGTKSLATAKMSDSIKTNATDDNRHKKGDVQGDHNVSEAVAEIHDKSVPHDKSHDDDDDNDDEDDDTLPLSPSKRALRGSENESEGNTYGSISNTK